MLSPKSQAAAVLPPLTAPLLLLAATTMPRSELRTRMKTTTALLRSTLKLREKRLFSFSLNLKSMLSLKVALSQAAAVLPALIAPLLLAATTMPRSALRLMTRTTTSKILPRSMPKLRLKLLKPSRKRPLSTLPTSCHRSALRTRSCSWPSLVTASHRNKLA